MKKHTPEIFYNRIGSNMRNARLNAGLTQKEVASGLEISFQQLQKYERGTNRCPVHHLIKFALMTDTSLSDLTGTTDVIGSSVNDKRELLLLRRLIALTDKDFIAVDRIISSLIGLRN